MPGGRDDEFVIHGIFEFSWALILVCLSVSKLVETVFLNFWRFMRFMLFIIYMLYSMLILSETFVDIARSGHMLIAFEQRTRP